MFPHERSSASVKVKNKQEVVFCSVQNVAICSSFVLSFFLRIKNIHWVTKKKTPTLHKLMLCHKWMSICDYAKKNPNKTKPKYYHVIVVMVQFININRPISVIEDTFSETRPTKWEVYICSVWEEYSYSTCTVTATIWLGIIDQKK